MARNGKKPLNLLIDDEKLIKFKKLCSIFETTMTDVLTACIDQYIKEKWPEMIRVMNEHNKYYPHNEQREQEKKE
jgi:hypothetical protein